MRNFILCGALLTLTACAGTISTQDLSANSWMPKTGSLPSCELPATITFNKDGTLSGEPGCNTLMGSYKIGANDSVKFDHMGLTRKMCAKEYMEQEESFLNLINQVAYIKKDTNELILLNKDKQEIGRLEPEKSGSCK